MHAYYGGEGLLLGLAAESLEAQMLEQARRGDLPDGLGRTIKMFIVPDGSSLATRLGVDEEEAMRRNGLLA